MPTETDDAREAGIHTEHGRRDASDTHIARTGHRRGQASPGEATRDQDDESLTTEKARGVIYSHEAHPSQRIEKETR